MQNYYTLNSKRTVDRVKALDAHSKVALSNHRSKKKKLRILKKSLDDAKRKHMRASAIFVGAELLQSFKEKELNFFLEKNPLLKTNIIPAINEICSLKKCSARYVRIPFCQICKDEVVKFHNSMKCDEEQKLLNTRTLVPFQTRCLVVNDTLTSTLSGFCPVNPTRQTKLEKQFISSNPSFKILMDSNLTQSVADTVRDINGLFLSCSKSHENITEKQTVQEPCIDVREEIKTIMQRMPKCQYIKSRIQTNLTASKKCNCKGNGYSVKISQTNCMLRNNECELKRIAKMQKSDAVPKNYADLSLSIYVLRARVNVALIEVERQRKNELFHHNQYFTAESLLYNSRMESISANKSRESVLNSLANEMCLVENYKSNKNISDLYMIKSIKFDTDLPIIKSIIMKVEVLLLVTMETVTIPLVYDLTDRFMSFKYIVKTIVQQLLCLSNERAGQEIRPVNDLKSIEGDNTYYSSWHHEIEHTWYHRNDTNDSRINLSNDKNGSTWYHDGDRNISKVQKACIDLQKVMDFLNMTANILMNITHEAVSLKEAIQQNSVMTAVSATNLTHYNYQSIIKAQNNLISSIESNMATIRKTAEIRYIMLEAREQLEVYVSLNNYTGCFSFDDCVSQAFEALENLPTAFTVPRDSFMQTVVTTSIALQNILSYVGEDLTSFSQLIVSYNEQLQHLYSLCLHCSDKPLIIDAVGNTTVLEVKAGKQFSVNCSFSSLLPVTVHWLKDDRVIDTRSTESLTITSSLSDSGLYKCLVVSPIGSAISSGTIVVVYTIPNMLNQPTSVRYLYPRTAENATFVCNAVGYPKPEIKWFFRPFNWRNFMQLKSENSPLLSITNPDVSKGGYYYCSATNKYGSVSSDRARLDVLRSSIAKLKITLSVVTNPLNTSTSFSRLEKMMTLHKGLNVSVNHIVRNNLTKLTVDILLDPNKWQKAHEKERLIDLVSSSRQDLAVSSALFVSKILNRSIKCDYGTAIFVNETSLLYQHHLNLCENGYVLDMDGFTCVQCPVGTAGTSCKPCVNASYQSKPGQKTCTRCPRHTFTDHVGSTSSKDCRSIGLFCATRKSGQYKHPTSCSKYIICKGGRTYLKSCEYGLYYDFITHECRWLFGTPYDLYVKHLRAWWEVCEW